LTLIEATYDPEFDACFPLKTHGGLVGAAAVLAADTVLFMLMLIGLLRHANRSAVGIWQLLYKQCIIWMTLAAVVEIPPLVFLVLNFNDAWNSMFSPVAVTILSICAARMYRSLSKQGSLTEYSSDPPQLPLSNFRHRETHSALHFRTTSGTLALPDSMAIEPFVFVPAEQSSPVDYFVPPGGGASDTTLAVPAKSRSKDIPVYRMSWHRPIDTSVRVLD